MSNTQLLALPANQLLNKFGSGTHAPGSGSAAALMGLLSCKLILTVTTLTLKKSEYRRDHSKIELIANQIIKDIEPRLFHLFEHDAQVFNEVILARVNRDKATFEKDKRHFSDLALKKIKRSY